VPLRLHPRMPMLSPIQVPSDASSLPLSGRGRSQIVLGSRNARFSADFFGVVVLDRSVRGLMSSPAPANVAAICSRLQHAHRRCPATRSWMLPSAPSPSPVLRPPQQKVHGCPSARCETSPFWRRKRAEVALDCAPDGHDWSPRCRSATS
jgi:hypothetical protein